MCLGSAASPQHRKSVCLSHGFVSSTHTGPALDLSQDLRRDCTVLSFHREGTQHTDPPVPGSSWQSEKEESDRFRREAQTTDRHHTLDNSNHPPSSVLRASGLRQFEVG